MPVRLPFVLLISLVLIALVGPAFADLSGQVKYSLENDYLDGTPTRRAFIQEYITNLRGKIYEGRIGAYYLGLQYQKGETELKNVNFSNTLNFRDALRVTTSYFRKDFGSSSYSGGETNDNRFSVAASYYLPALPTVMVAYEIGDSKAVSSEGVDKSDRKVEIGMNYAFLGNNISVRYVTSTLHDNTYLSSGGNLVNRDTAFTVNAAGSLGESVQMSSGYSDQQIFNQTGADSVFNQKLQSISAASNFRLLPNLSLSPEFSSTQNLVDYVVPIGQRNYQQSWRLGTMVNLQPLDQVGLFFDAGTGQIKFDDSLGSRKQDLNSRKVGLNVNFTKDFYLNMDLRKEDYNGGTIEGEATYANGYLTYLFADWIIFNYKRAVTRFDGEVFSLFSSGTGIKNEDLNDWGLGFLLSRSVRLDGHLSFSTLNSYQSQGGAVGIRYSPLDAGEFELKREQSSGQEASQTLDSQTDSLRANFSLGAASINEHVYFIKTKAQTGGTATERYGFRNYTEVNYSYGETSVALTVNSDKVDQTSSAYTRAYLSLARRF